jgi:adenosylhomocysteine nucleosidase
MHTLILIAIPEEVPVELQHRPDVFFTGVGKVNAAMVAAELIERYQPVRIINFGTAGGITLSTGLHQCTRFVQRDMTCEALDCVPGQTPFETDIAVEFDRAGYTCSTGDNFVMDPVLTIPADLVDMEAYAIAKCCQRKGIEFVCWKYVSDQANSDAHRDWQVSVAQGEQHYIAKLTELALD